MVCGFDSHTLIDYPNRCRFCGDAIDTCECINSSLVSGVMAFETPPEKERTKGRKRKAENSDDLGIHLDECLSYNEHITKTVLNCLLKLKQINRIKYLLDGKTLLLTGRCCRLLK